MPVQPIKPSIVRIIQSDYIATLSIIAPLVFLGMYLVITVFGFFPGLRGRDPISADGAPFFFWGAIVALLVGLPLAYWRVKRVTGVFGRGQTVTGVVEDVKFFRDRGSVVYVYHLDGQRYVGMNTINKTQRTTQLMKGVEVALVVDKSNPKRAFIRDLYV